MILDLLLWYQVVTAQPRVLASHQISLENRHEIQSVNQVFKDNILLTLSYLDSRVKDKSGIDWDNVNQPLTTGFTLKPGEKFAFHDEVLADYSKNLVQTTNAHFIGQEGFRTDGYLFGDGVCHLASLLYWVADDAGLTAYSPSDHNFAPINEVPKEYGVGILSPNPLGNLYIVNTRDNPVTFGFDWDGENLTVTALDNVE